MKKTELKEDITDVKVSNKELQHISYGLPIFLKKV